MQGNVWQEIFPTGSAPLARRYHAAAWSHTADGMYIFGGADFPDSGGPWLSLKSCDGSGSETV